jgi:hypothetical protein
MVRPANPSSGFARNGERLARLCRWLQLASTSKVPSETGARLPSYFSYASVELWNSAALSFRKPNS